MKIFCISDNRDTAIGLRLAGIESVIVSNRSEVLELLDKCEKDSEIGIVLMTTKAIEYCPEVISSKKLTMTKPLLVEIPDRHGSAKIGETIDGYISDAIGIKL